MTYTTADAQSHRDEKWLFDLDTTVPAVINELDDTLRSVANNYFYVPSHSNSLLYAANNKRLLTRSTLYDEDPSIYEFSSHLNISMMITS